MSWLLNKKSLVVLLCVLLFFPLVRYKGFDRDAALYLLQVVNSLHPERFMNDVPFMFGNQDAFSLFSPVIVLFFKLFGINVGGMVATFVLQLALGCAVIGFVYKWLRIFGLKAWAIPVTIIMFALLADKEYGPSGFYLPMFEPFLVARLPSEIFVVVGLAFLFNQNRFFSLVFFLLASAMHPLMGGWTLPLWLIYCFPKLRLPVLLVSLILPLSGFFHIGGLDFFSNDWNPVFFKPSWDDFLLYVGLLAFWLAMCRLLKEPRLSKFAISLFYISLIGFYLQFASSYLGHVLLFQAQPFRVQWLCTIPIVPVFAIYVHGRLRCNQEFNLQDAATFVLAMCTVAGYQWFILLAACLFLLYSPIGTSCKINVPKFWGGLIFLCSLIFLFLNSVLSNCVQLAIEQGIGSADFALAWMSVPENLEVVEKILLAVLSLICASQKKYGYALVFAICFCNGNLRVLPLIGVLLCLIPKLSKNVRNGLLSFALSCSVFELLDSLVQFNSSEISSLEGSPLACAMMFVSLFICSFWIMKVRESFNTRKIVVPLLVLVISFGAWDVYKWDARNETFSVNEKQMDSFFGSPIFPQVLDRGKMLFVVDFETPTQSRINFLTGAYADESINIGEVFFKEQFKESNRRRSALLTGTSKEVNLSKFSEQIMKIYHNPDTLLSRVRYLCGAGEITHFATDYGNMPLSRQDSVFLDVKQKYVWLYGCPAGE